MVYAGYQIRWGGGVNFRKFFCSALRTIFILLFTAVLSVGLGLPVTLPRFAGCVDPLHVIVPRLVGRRAERKYGLRLATPGLP